MAFQFSQTGQELQYIANLAQNRIATPFSTATSYNVGDYCTRNGVLYRCTTATTGAWDSTKWSSTTVGGRLTSISTNISNINSGRSNNEPSAVSVPNATWTLLASVSITDPGLYLFIAGGLFDANATGGRRIGYSTNTGSSPTGRRMVSTYAYSSGTATGVELIKILQYSNPGTFCVWGAQNSGSALNVSPWIEYIRLS